MYGIYIYIYLHEWLIFVGSMQANMSPSHGSVMGKNWSKFTGLGPRGAAHQPFEKLFMHKIFAS